MSDQDNAAQADTGIVIEGEDQTIENNQSESQQVESATATEENADEKQSDGFQTRINKVTADKYAEKRRADNLQKQIDKLEAAKPAETVKKPILDDFDTHEDFQQADIKYQIKQGVSEALSSQDANRNETRQKAESSLLLENFDKQVTALKVDDFYETAAKVPDLPFGVADAIMAEPNGAEIVLHLANHLDQADALAGMTPGAAMMEVGRITAKMSVKETKKPSAAPDPIEPLSSGGALTKDEGPDGATFE